MIEMSDSNDDFSGAFQEAAKAFAGNREGSTTEAGSEASHSGADARTDNGATDAAQRPAGSTESTDGKAAEQPASSKDEPGQAVEALKSELQAALHRERSVAGRISAVDSQNNQLRQQLNQLQETLNKLTSQKAAAAPAEPPKPDVLDETPELKQAVEKRVQERVEPLIKQLEQATNRAEAAAKSAAEANEAVKPLSIRERKATFEETWSALDKQFSEGWRSDVRSDRFRGWISEQPEAIKSLYEQAVTPNESAKVLRLFYAETGETRPSPQPNTSGPAAGANAPAAKPTQDPADRLRMAAGIPSRSTAQPSAPSADDFSGNFQRAFRQIRAANANA